MGRLIMWNLITLDGYFEGEKNWDLDFHEIVWGHELEKLSIEQLEKAEALLFGRVTYEGMAAYWQTAKGVIADQMNSIKKIVCSTTLKTADWNNSTLVKDNIPQQVAEIKSKSQKDIYIFGSSILSETLIRENLIDEYRICIVPVILGKGRPIFPSGLPETKLKLSSSRSLENGGILCFYDPT